METINTHIAAYCRVAYSDSLALEQQKIELQIFADENNYHNVIFYLDNGISGSPLDRPAFSRMNTDILAGQIDIVLVRDIARIGRNYCDVARWMKQLDELGISLIAVK